jgi:hypothetical protein
VEKLTEAPVLKSVAVAIGFAVSQLAAVSQYSFTSLRPTMSPVDDDAVIASEVSVVVTVVVSLNAPPI